MLSAEATGGLVILSGPSCVGKSPLAKALRRFHPDLSAKLQPIVLYNSRSPRPGERDGEDYHFRPREQIEALRDRERYVVMECAATCKPWTWRTCPHCSTRAMRSSRGTRSSV